jgi:hypothetical protein
MTEPVLALLKRAQAALLAKAAQRLGSNSLDPAALGAMEGFAQQLDDRAQQCADWIFGIERWGDRTPKNREDDIRASCAEWLRMAE